MFLFRRDNMSFLSEITKQTNGGNFVSFNNSFSCSEYKIIIVGTITSPSGRKGNNGFFYMSPKNRMYKIIDNYFINNRIITHFDEYKKKWDIASLKKELCDKKILFLDTVESCSNPKNSWKDDDLKSIKLDYQSFKNIREDALVVANSKNAYFSLLKILNENNQTHTVYLCKLFRSFSQSGWNNIFKKAGI